MNRSWKPVLPAVAAALLCGCQRYAARPLDVGATREAWSARLPSDESAREFAARLAAAEGRGGAFDPADGLTLEEGEAVALVFNRELRAARLEAGVSRATADHAGTWDDPALGVDIERIVSGGVSDPWVVGGTVGLTIPISGRLKAEKGRAGAAHAAELQRVAAREWTTRSALRELWVEWSAESARLELLNGLVGRLRDVAALAERQERAGVMSRIDSRLFRVELVGIEADLIGARARVEGLELRLRDVLGLAPGAPVRLVGAVAFTPRGTDAAWLAAAMEAGNPELAAARGEYEAAERALRVEMREQYPDLEIGPGFGTDQGDERLLLGVRLPLPVWNRNRQGVAEALAAREAARGRFEGTYEQLGFRLASARSRYEAGRAMREAVESRVVPLADEQDAEVRRVAELGRVDPLVLLEALKSQHGARERLVGAMAAEAIGAIGLDELIGPPVAASEGSDR